MVHRPECVAGPLDPDVIVPQAGGWGTEPCRCALLSILSGLPLHFFCPARYMPRPTPSAPPGATTPSFPPSSTASTSNPATWSWSTAARPTTVRSEEHTSELQSLMRISYAVFCLKKKIQKKPILLD